MTKLTVAANGVIEDQAMIAIASKRPGDAINLFVCTVDGKLYLLDRPLNCGGPVPAKSKMVHYTLSQEDIDAGHKRIEEIREWEARYGIPHKAVIAMVNALTG